MIHDNVLPITEFARLRHRMWLTKTYGAKRYPLPDAASALTPYHFTNLWRELDRNSVYLFNDVQQPHGDDLTGAVLDTLRFRVFNKIETLDAVRKEFGLLDVAFSSGKNLFAFLKDREANFTGAYIRCPSLERLCDAVQSSRLAPLADHRTALLRAGDGRGVRKKVTELYSIGSFLADQLTMDLTWIGGPVDQETGRDAENLFTPKFGPGAKRGEKYCLETGQGTAQEVLENIRQVFASEPVPRVYGKPVGFNGRELEHTLCEYQKHVRVARATSPAGGKMRVFNQQRDPNRRAVAALPYTWKDAR